MTSFPTLETILTDHYRTTTMVFDPTPVLWAAERAVAIVGLEATQRELTALNRLRERRGLMPAVPAFGNPLFRSVSDIRKASAQKGARTRARNLANRPAWRVQ